MKSSSKIKRTTILKKLMDAFCERQGIRCSRVQPPDSLNTVSTSSRTAKEALSFHFHLFCPFAMCNKTKKPFFQSHDKSCAETKWCVRKGVSRSQEHPYGFATAIRGNLRGGGRYLIIFIGPSVSPLAGGALDFLKPPFVQPTKGFKG
jgi:hypothetical protein